MKEMKGIMKVLLVVTGRGMGGDAVTALNIGQTLEDKGVQCEYALDSSAPGLLFKKNNIKWYKVDVPQAGGHAATKKNMLLAGFKTLKASIKTRSLIKKIRPDVVVGVIGGGAVVGSISAKLSNVPSVSIINTPLDTKICTKLNTCISLTESYLFKAKTRPKNVYKSYYPLKSGIDKGNKENALSKLPKSFDPDKITILFSSGSSLFEKMAQAVHDYSIYSEDVNIIVVGHPLEDKYYELLNNDNIINLEYIDWIKDLYELVDLAILTDDGVMVQEAISHKLPIISLNRVKYGRYHNIEAIFPGAVVETDLNNLKEEINNQLKHLDILRNNAEKYSENILLASEKIADIIISKI
jgi:UDP-N-acetylglucosamine--N-acetylmuramyl-(pentapeptide) pyrophosphoryl-undecaprenol N-acetylglucosamine transferase